MAKHRTALLGAGPEGRLSFDIDILAETRLLIQANSGAGKSWAIRRLLEQSYGKIQHIVLDVEGEFHTLREKFDYLLIGGEHGDCPLSVQSAKLLARRVLKLQCSVIIQIDEMEAHQRQAFMRNFLKSLISAPKSLRHPCLVVIDEAHVFAPEKGKSESAGAVIDLMTRGRKRGLCGVLATQRISKLNKDATAEANNKLIGRAAQDIDRKRAAEELGLVHRQDILSLRDMKPGDFYVFGPAISQAVVGVRVGEVKTTHPKVGRREAPPPPPRGAIKKLLSELADLPQEAVQEAQDLVAARTEIQSLKAALRAAEKSKTKPEVIRASNDPELRQRLRAAESTIKNLKRQLVKAGATQTAAFNKVVGRIMDIESEAKRAIELANEFVTVEALVDLPDELFEGIQEFKEARRQETAAPRRQVSTPEPSDNGDLSMTSGAGKILNVLTSRYPMKLTKQQLAVMAGYKWKGGSYRTYVSRLKVNGYIVLEGSYYQATEKGLEALGAEPTPPQTTLELVNMWVNAVGGKAGEMLRIIVDEHPHEIEKEELAARVEMTPDGGSFRTYLSRLRSNGLIEGRDAVKASDTLFM